MDCGAPTTHPTDFSHSLFGARRGPRACVCVRACMCVCVQACLWRSDDKFWELVPSYFVGPRDQTHTKLGGKHLTH